MRKLLTINLKCIDCFSEVNFPPWRARKYQNNGWRCKSCSSKFVYKNHDDEIKLKIINAIAEGRKNISSDKLSEIGKKRRSFVKISGKEMRERQQKTINNDPIRYAAYCEKRRQIAQNFHDNMTDSDKAVFYTKVLKNVGISKAEKEFFADLKKHNLFFERNIPISGFIVDGLQNKTIVEFYGDTFHCNPKKYTDAEQYCSWIKRTVGDQWKRDQRRLGCFYKLGYKVVIVWQSDWIKNKQLVIERIKNALY